MAPHRIEAFVWQLLHGKIGVKVELAVRGIFHESSNLCVLCIVDKETCCHLFTKCNETWKIWGMWCKLFNISWITPGFVVTFFEAWNNCHVGKHNSRLWKLAYFTIVWTIWKSRSEVVFKRKKWDDKECWELVKFRIASWANAKWPKDYGSISDIFFNPSVGSYVRMKQK